MAVLWHFPHDIESPPSGGARRTQTKREKTLFEAEKIAYLRGTNTVLARRLTHLHLGLGESERLNSKSVYLRGAVVAGRSSPPPGGTLVLCGFNFIQYRFHVSLSLAFRGDFLEILKNSCLLRFIIPV